MQRTPFILWAVAMWVTPAIVADMIGWRGIWGGGSAFGDLIVPAPITGGIFHVPTFILALVFVPSYKKLSAPEASVVRAGLVAAALVGFAHLIDWEELFLSYSTDLRWHGMPWQRDYFGLCLMTDALWSLVWTYGRPALRTLWAPAILIVIIPPSLYVYRTIETSERLREPFLTGRSHTAASRGEAIRYVYTRMSVSDPAFRQRAEVIIETARPEKDPSVEDVALYFTDSLNTAKRGTGRIPLTTLCLYEDGTPDLWLEGQADCFSAHETFEERRKALSGKAHSNVPDEVWTFAVERVLCSGVEIPEVFYQGLARANHCAGVDLGKMLNALEEKYESAELENSLRAAQDVLGSE